MINSPSALEQDLIMGCFVNRTTYLKQLGQSISKYLPDIPFIIRYNNGGMNAGFNLIRENFIKSGKRFFLWIDDDIVFLNPSIIHDALVTLVSNKAGAVTVYMTHNPEYITRPYNVNGLTSHIMPWAVGYFLLIDSHKVGNLICDPELPFPNTDTDVACSMEIRKAGYDIWIDKNMVYHTKKEVIPRNGETTNEDALNKSREYLSNKYGQFYRDYFTSINVAVL